MKKSPLYPLLVVFMASCFLYSCSFEKIGNDVGKGVSSQTDSIGRGLVAGIRDELTSPETVQKLSRFLDSLTQSLMDTFTVKAVTLEDSLLNPKVKIWVDSIVEALSGTHLKMNIADIQAALVGKTKKDVLEMKNYFSQLLQEVLSDSTRYKIGQIRNELLGPNTTMAISKIIDTAVAHIVDSSMNRISMRLRTDINPLLKEDVSFIQRNAIWLLVALGAIAAGIIILVWRNKQKYLHMLSIITKQVNDIPDQKIYDVVTSKIQSDSVAAGIEPDLRELLSKNGLIGTDAWKKKQHTNNSL